VEQLENLMNKYPENELMIKEQIMRRGVTDENVISAFRATPREFFVHGLSKQIIYFDSPQSIGYGQTISQPYMVALMTEQLRLTGKEKVLEIGTGSGYQTAVLARLAKQVYTVERISELSLRARQNLDRLGITNVSFAVADGSLGLPEFAPYDRIIVTCAMPENKLSVSPLLEQIADNGFILAPVGSEFFQILTRVRKIRRRIEKEQISSCVFVQMIGKYGW